MPDGRPNVLLVVLDSVRARNCSCYGHRRDTTPFLGSLAAESTLYTQARAPSNWSLPSHVSLFTGVEAHAHRVTTHDRLKPGNTVFDALADRGYRTGLFTENGFVASHEAGLHRAFGTVRTVPDGYDPVYDTTDHNPGPDGFYYADAFEAWRVSGTEPWAACLNLMDAHRPFEPRARFDRWGDSRARSFQADLPTRWEWAFHGGARPYDRLSELERLYDGGIRQADAIVARVVDRLRDSGALDNTLLVVCGDHGDGFGEPGLIDGEPPAVSHIVPMHEALLRVPLLVRPPGGTDGRTCHDPAALTAFPDVVTDTVDGGHVADGFARDRVYAAKQPVTAELRERFEDACADPERFLAPSRAVYRPDADDPRAVRKRYYWGERAVECRIRTPGEPSVVTRITPGRVDTAFDEPDPTPEIRAPLDGDQVTDATREQLAALGYY
jgi:arylsulfatase A